MFRNRFNLRKMVAIAICLASTTMFLGCDKDDKEPPKDPLTYDKGVVINGVKWATRNVAAPGTFAANPEDAGMFYQWNRKKAWPTTGNITDWNTTFPEGNTWEKSNDPSPAGWRVPTLNEIETLFDNEKVTHELTEVNGVYGRKFTDKAKGNSIFFPAAGFRYFNDGTLYVDGRGGYWSSTPSENNNTYFLNLKEGRVGIFYGSIGYSVRSVEN